jgi:sugar lactone lactonase YvrE
VGNIYSFDFDVETGALGNQQVFVHLEPDEGFPDGLCVDAEGAIWTALWAGSAVRRYSPNGEHIGTVEVAASHVTSCTFVGAALNSLVITSAKDELPEEVLAVEPHAGSIFVAEVDVTGVVGTSCTVTTDGWRRTF